MDAAALLLIQISTLFLLVPIYAALTFLIYKIYYYEQLISNTKEFRDIKLFISRLNKPKNERSRDLSEITELAILVAKSAGEKLFNLFLHVSEHAPNDRQTTDDQLKPTQNQPKPPQGQKNPLNKQQNLNENIEKMCSWVCGMVYDVCCGSEY